MKDLHPTRFLCFLLSFSLMIAPLPLSAMIEYLVVPIADLQTELAIPDTDHSYVYLGKELSNIGYVISAISKLDKSHHSPLIQLKEYIEKGLFLARHDDIADILQYAEQLLRTHYATLDPHIAEKLYADLDCIIQQFMNGSLSVKISKEHDNATQRSYINIITVQGLLSVNDQVVQNITAIDLSATDAIIQNATISFLSTSEQVIQNVSITNLSVMDETVTDTLSVNDEVIKNNLYFTDNSGTKFVGLTAPTSVSSNYTLALPATAPTANQVLQANATTPTNLQWFTFGGTVLPAVSRTIYVAQYGNDVTGDGSCENPYASLSQAINVANTLANVNDPICIFMYPGNYIEDNSAGPLTITTDGISIVGFSPEATYIFPSTPANDFILANGTIRIANVAIESTSPLATGLSLAVGNLSTFDNVRFANFLTGVACSGGVNQLYGFNACTFVANGTGLSIDTCRAETIGCDFFGVFSISAPAANTAISITGSGANLVVSGGAIAKCDTGFNIANNSTITITGVAFKFNTTDIIQSGASNMVLNGATFELTNSNSDIDIQISGAGTNAEIVGCQFDGNSSLGVPQATAIAVTNNASLSISSGSITNYTTGIQVGISSDTSSTILSASNITINNCTNDVIQNGSTTVNITASSARLDTITINDATNVTLAVFDIGDNNVLTIGSLSDEDTPLVQAAINTITHPELLYKSSLYTAQAMGFYNPLSNPSSLFVQSTDNTDVTAITTDRTKIAGLRLVSDTGSPVGGTSALRGWDINKNGSSAQLSFIYQNSDVVGQSSISPYVVMQLDGVNNQLQLPTANTKIVFDADTNLYRSAASVLKTDDNFIVGTLTPGRVVITDPTTNQLSSSVTTSTEISYVSGVTSAIQTQLNGKVSKAGDTMTGALTLPAGTAAVPSLQFTGSTNTGLSAATANVLSFDINGTEKMNISSSGLTIDSFTTAGIVHNNAAGLLSSSLIVNADIDPAAAIADSKLATISTAGKVANSATTATSANTPSAIVSRDSSGNFSAGTITANLSGNATTATTATNFSGSLSGDVTGTQSATVVSTVGGQSAANVAAATVLANAATSADTASTIVKRTAAGGFSAGAISVTDEVISNSATITPFSTAGVVHNDATGLLSSSLIVNADIDPAAAIADSKLATISTAGKVANSATTATSVNTSSTIVARDSSGNFSAGTITANLSGNATTATTATNFSGSLSGDVTGTQSATVVSTVGGQSASNVAAATVLANAATSADTASTIVKRTSSGGFSAGAISITDTVISNTATITPFSTAGVVHNDATGLLSSSLIVNADIDPAAAITDTKLATISTAGKVANSATTATSVNTASAIVARDSSGNFSAGTITANLSGNATTATTATNFSGSLSGDVTGTQSATVVSTVGGQSASNIAAATVLANAATSADTASTIVKRTAAGGFSAGAISVTDEVISNTATITPFSTAGVVHNDATGLLSSSLIVNADISSSAAIADSKLATISTAGKVANSATTATSANTANAIVARDASGNFSAGTITATLSGNATTATTATTATNFSGSLSGDVTGTQSATVVSTVGGQSAANVAAATVLANAATSADTASTIVKRTASGGFSAGAISMTDAVITNSATITPFNTAGVIHNDSTGLLSSSLIVDADITTATITNDKLANISSTNTPGDIVVRDNSGNFATNMITIAGTTTNNTDVATKAYVDSAISTGLVAKNPAIVVSTTDIGSPPAGLQTIDGVTLSTNDRVLLVGQTNQVQNGLWLAQAGNWTRPTDFASGTQAGQAYVLILEGTTEGGSSWLCNTPTAIIDTDPITFALFSLPNSTTGANVGAGTGLIFRNTTGNTLNFKSLIAGSHINITNNANDITIATDGTSSNTASTLVARDASGNFSAGTITASLSGNATTATTATNFSGSLSGDVTGTQGATVVSTVGGQSASNVAAATVLANAATNLDTINAIVKRDGTGSFAAGVISVTDEVISNTVTITPFSTAGVVHNDATGLLSSSLIVNADISSSAAIADTKLATISTAGKVANSATTATSTNTASAIVARDASGNFSAGTITATLSGNATTATTATNFSGSLSGDVTGTQSATVVSTVGGQSAANVAAATALANAATNLDTINTIVKRDGTGSFAAGVISVTDEVISNTVTITPFNTAGVVHNSAAGLLSSSLIVNADIDPAAAIADTKLATISTAGKVANSATTATSANTANAIVARDASGNFSAGTITANLSGNATTATTATNFSGSLSGDVTGTQSATVVSTVGGQSAANVAAATALANAATNLDTINTIVKRDGTGSFAAGVISVTDEVISNSATITPFNTAGVVHNNASGLLSSSLIVNADISSSAAIADTKLATISTAGKVANSATTATSANTASAIVARDASGNFSAGTITANLSGNATTATTATNFSGSLSGDVTGTQGATVVSTVGGQSAANVAAATVLANAATNLDTINTIVKRDGTGSFAAGVISVTDEVISNTATITPFNTAGVVHNDATGLLSSSLIVNADISSSAAIADTKLATISTAGKVANSATTATSANTASAIVARDASGNFSAGTITANLTGNVTGNVTGHASQDLALTGGTLTGTLTLPAGTALAPSLQFTGSTNTGLSAATANVLSFDVSGAEVMNVSASGVTIDGFTTAGVVHNSAAGLLTSSLIVDADITAATITNDKLANISSSNVANDIVVRDSSGNFAAGTISANLIGSVTGHASLDLPLTGGTLTGTLQLPAGTTALPSLVFTGSTTTGLSASAGALSFSTSGAEQLKISSGGTISIDAFTTAGVVHNDASGNLSSSLIVNSDIAANAGIVDSKLATISTAGKVANSATTATSANTANAIVARDASGNFSAGTITANLTGNVTGSVTGHASLDLALTGGTLTGTLTLPAGTAAAPSLQFTGSTNTGLSAATANVLSLDVSGAEIMNVSSSGVTIDGFTTAGVVHNSAAGLLSSSLIVNADITNATITNAKLAAISSSNVANDIVVRDASGNFSAGTITATLSGNATTATTATNFSGSLSGDVTGTQSATVVSTVGGQTAANVAAATVLANAATNTNTANTLVERDGTGSFAAQEVSMNDGIIAGNLILSTEPSTSTAGNILKGSSSFIHDFGTNNTFVGINAGNFTMSGSGDNVGIGTSALNANTTGAFNTAIGFNALTANTTGTQNTALGYRALVATTIGTQNTAVGFNVMVSNTTGSNNTVIGRAALAGNATGSGNTVVGTNAMQNGTTGSNNTAIGGGALQNNNADNNTALGGSALNANTTGTNNTAVGSSALHANTVGVRNTALGFNALTANTTGTDNTAIGYNALAANATGTSLSTAVGSSALAANTTGTGNTAVGYSALAANTTGQNNSAFGLNALALSTTAIQNTAIGSSTLSANTLGVDNTGVGYEALNANTTGNQNTALGSQALTLNTIGTANTAIGYLALNSNTTGINNVAIGGSASTTNSTGQSITAVGQGALSSNTVDAGTAVGFRALFANTTGTQNSAVGYHALTANTTGINNTALGHSALAANTTGTNNTALGTNTLAAVTTGSNNIAIGNSAGGTLTTGSNNIYIGLSAASSSESSVTKIANIRGVTTVNANAITVLVDSAGQLGTTSSSRAVKHNIQDMNDESENIYQLRPVTFAYNCDATETKQYGLIAEEVNEVFPTIVATDNDGQPESVQYHVLPVLLLNEIQKQHVIIGNLQKKCEQVDLLSAMVEQCEQRIRDLEKRVLCP